MVTNRECVKMQSQKSITIVISHRPTHAVQNVYLFVNAACNGNDQPMDKKKNEAFSSVAP